MLTPRGHATEVPWFLLFPGLDCFTPPLFLWDTPGSHKTFPSTLCTPLSYLECLLLTAKRYRGYQNGCTPTAEPPVSSQCDWFQRAGEFHEVVFRHSHLVLWLLRVVIINFSTWSFYPLISKRTCVLTWFSQTDLNSNTCFYSSRNCSCVFQVTCPNPGVEKYTYHLLQILINIFSSFEVAPKH